MDVYKHHNQIRPDVIIHSNVCIGVGNVIESGTVIYENTVIGNNNVILQNNKLGTLPVETYHDYQRVPSKGLIIGNDNFFHIENVISSGCYNVTKIGDGNKILSQCYISHDTVISNGVTLYPRVFTAGLVKIYDHASVGAGAYIHQRRKIGAYSMVGMNTTVVKNTLPYLITVNGKYTNINSKKVNQMTDITIPDTQFIEYSFTHSNDDNNLVQIKTHLTQCKDHITSDLYDHYCEIICDDDSDE